MFQFESFKCHLVFLYWSQWSCTCAQKRFFVMLQYFLVTPRFVFFLARARYGLVFRPGRPPSCNMNHLYHIFLSDTQAHSCHEKVWHAGWPGWPAAPDWPKIFLFGRETNIRPKIWVSLVVHILSPAFFHHENSRCRLFVYNYWTLFRHTWGDDMWEHHLASKDHPPQILKQQPHLPGMTSKNILRK